MGPGSPADASNGYEDVAADFVAVRSASTIGVDTVRRWASGLPPGAAVLDLGCGHGLPISAALLEVGATLHGIDGSPTLVAAFRDRFPGVPVECGPVESSRFFARTFDAVLAWGLMFLLTPAAQAALIRKVASALKPGGSFLFTSPAEPCEWTDVLTGRTSVSLGADAYRRLAEAAGLTIIDESEDEGQNHYFLARKSEVRSEVSGPR